MNQIWEHRVHLVHVVEVLTYYTLEPSPMVLQMLVLQMHEKWPSRLIGICMRFTTVHIKAVALTSFHKTEVDEGREANSTLKESRRAIMIIF